MLEIIKKYELHYSDSLVGKTCHYVMEHVEENIKLDDIANDIHISKDYIGKLFKQKTGYSFINYVTKVKMEHAKQLIVTGEYKNYEISEKLGYSNSDYFCHLFKGYTGYTPIEFRKMNT
jgi:two-component system response regulator YesN